jgi:hypothetical protein
MLVPGAGAIFSEHWETFLDRQDQRRELDA